MKDDEARKRILARRAQFIVAAVAGIVACEPSADSAPPSICLSISVVPPAEGGAGPTIVDAGAVIEPDAAAPCLSVAPPRDAGATPRPCLTKVVPPRICLDFSE